MGHATRSWPVVQYLSQRYEVHVFAGGRVHEYLVSRVEHLHWIQTMALVYKNNVVDVAASARLNLSKIPQVLWSAGKFSSLALSLRPRVLVTDFEGISTYMAHALGMKVVSFDNQHIFKRTAVQYPQRFQREAAALSKAIFWTVPHAHRYVVSTFFHPHVTRPNTRLVPSIVRPEVLALKPTTSDTVLVYQTSASNTRLIPVLNRVDAKFVVYGLHREEQVGNCSLRSFSEARFLEDLARARAVITNGGHTLISEALALGKPVFSEPVAGQFEQMINAIYIEKLGFGVFSERMTPDQVTDFLQRLPLFARTIAQNYAGADNLHALQTLEQAILELSPALLELQEVSARSLGQVNKPPVEPLLPAHHGVGVKTSQDLGDKLPAAPDDAAGQVDGVEDGDEP